MIIPPPHSSPPFLPPGFLGFCGVDPLVAQVEKSSEAAAEALEKSLHTRPVYGRPQDDAEKGGPLRFPEARAGKPWDARTSKVVLEAAVSQSRRGLVVPQKPPTLSMESARLAAARMRETFGLSIFGFDLIVDKATGENMVIDVNYFPSFKDLSDFPQVCLCGRLKVYELRYRQEMWGS